ncbi:unnamed protein product [Somion occarium]|uniref:C2H2-type domain-containing protein n=1 Tax=Somion occarium TaxID=3059160 RepID=A0ABP1DLN6_9APHY
MSEYVQMYPDGSHSPIRCPDPTCHVQVARFEDWLAHIRTHVTDGRDDTACPWMGCDRAYQRQHWLYEHVKSHIGFNDLVCPHLTDSRPGSRVRCTYTSCYSHLFGTHRSKIHGWNKKCRDSIDPYVDDLSQDLESVVLSGGNIKRVQDPAGGDRRDDGDGANPHLQPEDIKAEPEDLDVPGHGIGADGDGVLPAAMPMGGPGIPGPAGPMHNNPIRLNPYGVNRLPWRLAPLPGRALITVPELHAVYSPLAYTEVIYDAQDRRICRLVVEYIKREEVLYRRIPVEY